LLLLSYIVMLALYAQAFGSYAASFLPQSAHTPGKHGFLTAAIVVITAGNIAGAATVARAERGHQPIAPNQCRNLPALVSAWKQWCGFRLHSGGAR
jgi:amino acid transporter